LGFSSTACAGGVHLGSGVPRLLDIRGFRAKRLPINDVVEKRNQVVEAEHEAGCLAPGSRMPLSEADRQVKDPTLAKRDSSFTNPFVEETHNFVFIHTATLCLEHIHNSLVRPHQMLFE
jgi:hypothetical protein